MNYLIYDTETNGFPPKARMTQLAFILFNDEGEILDEYQAFIKPNGWTIPKEKFFLDNNMTTERNEELGVPVHLVVNKFHEALNLAEYKIAHNHNFDKQVVANEIALAGVKTDFFHWKKEFCTMLSTIDFVGAIDRWGKPKKWPKLEELHIKCFGENFDGAHDALADVRATMKCFLFLKEKGVIKL